MRCLNPRTVGFKDDGKTLSWSQKDYNKEYATFQLPCGKCLECRLEYARQWAVRCVHEAQMHEQNSFITLTYSDEKLKSEKLQYKDFQDFIHRLRDKIFRDHIAKNFGDTYWTNLTPQERKAFRVTHKEDLKKIQIGIFVTGEYGDKRKRPHWHAIIFNWRPNDLVPKYTSDRGDRVYDSPTLDKLWGHGITEVGSVTFESAGYCARYAVKKLAHGKDQEHEFQPISKKSSKNAIGKKFVEKYYSDVFNLGQVVLPDGKTCAIPRYYEKWLKKHKPLEWKEYVTRLKAEITSRATVKAEREKIRENIINNNRAARQKQATTHQRTKNGARKIIIEQKTKQLQKNLKL